jgi:hypothetical protein
LDINDSLLNSGCSESEKNTVIGFYRVDNNGNVVNDSTPNPHYLSNLLSPALEDISSLGRYYANQIQSEESFIPAPLLPTQQFNLFTLSEGDLLADESYLEYKNYTNLFNLNSYTAKPIFNTSIYSQSAFHVLNSFRSNYEDFS